jgi:hypothetical protein
VAKQAVGEIASDGDEFVVVKVVGIVERRRDRDSRRWRRFQSQPAASQSASSKEATSDRECVALRQVSETITPQRAAGGVQMLRDGEMIASVVGSRKVMEREVERRISKGQSRGWQSRLDCARGHRGGGARTQVARDRVAHDLGYLSDDELRRSVGELLASLPSVQMPSSFGRRLLFVVIVSPLVVVVRSSFPPPSRHVWSTQILGCPPPCKRAVSSSRSLLPLQGFA